jgi:hypothetical protein
VRVGQKALKTEFHPAAGGNDGYFVVKKPELKIGEDWKVDFGEDGKTEL